MLSWVNIIKIYNFICRWSHANIFTHNAIEYERYNHLYAHVSKRIFLRWRTAKKHIYTVLLAEIFICISIQMTSTFQKLFFQRQLNTTLLVSTQELLENLHFQKLFSHSYLQACKSLHTNDIATSLYSTASLQLSFV